MRYWSWRGVARGCDSWCLGSRESDPAVAKRCCAAKSGGAGRRDKSDQDLAGVVRAGQWRLEAQPGDAAAQPQIQAFGINARHAPAGAIQTEQLVGVELEGIGM